jgi:hypothetical protein
MEIVRGFYKVKVTDQAWSLESLVCCRAGVDVAVGAARVIIIVEAKCVMPQASNTVSNPAANLQTTTLCR